MGEGVVHILEYGGSNPVEIKSRAIENQSFKVIKGPEKCVDCTVKNVIKYSETGAENYLHCYIL